MLTKTQATTLSTSTAINQFLAQLASTLEANALRGIVGVSAFPYPPSATNAQITAFTTARQGEGWTVAVDNVGFTVTLS